MLNWLAEFGASDPELSIPAPEVDMDLVPRSNALQPRSKQSKRRVTEGGDGPSGPRRRVGQGRGAHDENGISIEVQVRISDRCYCVLESQIILSPGWIDT